MNNKTPCVINLGTGWCPPKESKEPDILLLHKAAPEEGYPRSHTGTHPQVNTPMHERVHTHSHSLRATLQPQRMNRTWQAQCLTIHLLLKMVLKL